MEPKGTKNPSFSSAQVLHANLATMGLVKTLPYLVMFAASNLGGWAGDYLINVRHASVAGGRKWVNTAGFWGAAVALMLMPGRPRLREGGGLGEPRFSSFLEIDMEHCSYFGVGGSFLFCAMRSPWAQFWC
jgi:hypothetical protein